MVKSKSRLFLLELTICLLFFGVTAAICAAAFGKAAVMSRDARALSWACMLCQGEAQRFMAGENVEPEAFDKDFAPTEDDGVYVLEAVTEQEQNGLERLELRVVRRDREVYRLSAVRKDGDEP